VILVVIINIGFSLALALPWLIKSQSYAAIYDPGINKIIPESITTTYYVAITGTGSGGLSWTDAFTNVQDALAVAIDPSEIWVAKGVYYPDVGGGKSKNNPNESFVLKDGVILYGGFLFGETDFNNRDLSDNLTILSGDIDGNDKTDGDGVVNYWMDIKGRNAYHVVTAIGVNDTAVLDGFVITAGQADENFPNNLGGGFYCDGSGGGNNCSPTLSYVTFTSNLANDGGAMSNYCQGGTCSPALYNVTFMNNSAVFDGGAMYNGGKDGTYNPTLVNVDFIGNGADGAGGAMFNLGWEGSSNPSLKNVRFLENSSSHGGAIYFLCQNGQCNPNLTNVTFSKNYAYFGGAMYSSVTESGNSFPNLTNVVFSGNTAEWDGGALYIYASNGQNNPKMINVTFSGNSSENDGGAIYNNGTLGIVSTKIQNCILWNNKDSSGIGTINANLSNNTAAVTLTHSLLQGSFPMGSWIGGSFINGGGNIDGNPLFLGPIDPNSAPTSNGNLRLQSSSPAIDKGNNAYIAGFITDLDGQPRIVDGDKDGTPTVDMGAYEYIEYLYVGYIPLMFR
jgi:predicted outer membrane repeat protein